MIHEFVLDNRRARPADPGQPGGLAPAAQVRGRLIVNDDEIRVKVEPNGAELSVLTFDVALMLASLPAPKPGEEGSTVQLPLPEGPQATRPPASPATAAPVPQADGDQGGAVETDAEDKAKKSSLRYRLFGDTASTPSKKKEN